MRGLWIFCSMVCMGASFDLGPIVRIAQCRSQCLKKHSVDGTCDWFADRRESTCSECWQNCEALENQWEDTRTICEGDQYLSCPACQTACSYRKTRVEERYVPSMLPAPSKGPVNIGRFNVAVVMRKTRKQWKESGYYPGGRAPSLRPDTWIIVVLEDGVKHYSWQQWYPTLDSLRSGPLYEASISWKDVQTQLKNQRDLEQKRFNDRVRQFFLEKYGERVLAEWRSQEDSQISEEVFRRFFFKRKDEQADRALEADNSPATGDSFPVGKDERSREEDEKRSYVVSWEPETGGLMGNQVTDSKSAQISLLPGTKYLVRIASDEGPGSFPILVDTRPGSDQVELGRIVTNRTPGNGTDTWRVYYAACGSAILLAIALLCLLKVCRTGKRIEIEEV